MTDCIFSGLWFSERAIAGKAVFKIVASSDCRKNAIATSQSKRSLCGANGAGAAVSAVMGKTKAADEQRLGKESDCGRSVNKRQLSQARGDYTEKLEPQPQVVVAFGFLMTNCAPCRAPL